jgi:hypothetical protein
MKKINLKTSTILTTIITLFLISSYVAILFILKPGTGNKGIDIYTPTTTPTLTASFKDDEITKVGELKYNGTTYIGDIYVRYTDKIRDIFF